MLILLLTVAIPLYAFSLSDSAEALISENAGLTFSVFFGQVEGPDEHIIIRDAHNEYHLYHLRNENIVRVVKLPPIFKEISRMETQADGYLLHGNIGYELVSSITDSEVIVKINHYGELRSYYFPQAKIAPVSPIMQGKQKNGRFLFEWFAVSSEPFVFRILAGPSKNQLRILRENLYLNYIEIKGEDLKGMPQVFWKIEGIRNDGTIVESPLASFYTGFEPSIGKTSETGIEGVVRDAETLLPLEKASVILLDQKTRIREEVATDESGFFSFNIAPGKDYQLTVYKKGYLEACYESIEVVSQRNTFLEPILQIDEERSGAGVLRGRIVEATVKDQGIPNVSVWVRQGINQSEGEPVFQSVSLSDGSFVLEGVPVGNYTLQFQAEGYIDNHAQMVSLGETHVTELTVTMARTPDNVESVRIVLSWGTEGLDLDAHLTGPLPDGGKFHMFHALAESQGGSKWPEYVKLDLDNRIGKEGPETISILSPVKTGIYRYSVRDYSNREILKCKALSGSNAIATVYQGNRLIGRYPVPANREGQFWNVFELYFDGDGKAIVSPYNVLTDAYNSIWVAEEYVSFPKPLMSLPPEDWPEEMSAKAMPVSEILIEEVSLEIGIDSEKMSGILLSFPAGEKIELENVAVFVDDTPRGSLIYEFRQIKTAADIMFVVDTTGSMGEEINGIKNSLSDFVEYLNIVGLDVMIGLIPFDDFAPSRDIAINPKWLDLCSKNEALEYIKQLRANGGDDNPENPYAALMFAGENPKWRFGSERISVLITDVSAHYPGSEGDAGSSAKHSKEDVIRAHKGLYTVHSIITPGEYKPTDSNYAQLGDPREISVVTGGTIAYTDAKGNIDLTKTGILDFFENSFYIMFESDPSVTGKEIEVFYETTQGKGKLTFYPSIP